MYGKCGLHEWGDVCHADESDADGFFVVAEVVAVVVGLGMVKELFGNGWVEAFGVFAGFGGDGEDFANAAYGLLVEVGLAFGEVVLVGVFVLFGGDAVFDGAVVFVCP